MVVSLFLGTTRGHCAALLWGWRAVKLTIGSNDVHPELEAFLAMVVQGLCCRGERRNTGVNILSNALILNWPFKSPSCMHSLTHIHKQLAGDRHRDKALGCHLWSKVCPAVYLITAMVRVTTCACSLRLHSSRVSNAESWQTEPTPLLMSMSSFNKLATKFRRSTACRKTRQISEALTSQWRGRFEAC